MTEAHRSADPKSFVNRWPRGPRFKRIRARAFGNLALNVEHGQIWMTKPAQGYVSLSVDELQALVKFARDAKPTEKRR